MTNRTKTGGRKQGSKNRRTALLDNAAKKGTLPLDYMLKVVRDPKADKERRDDMGQSCRALSPRTQSARG